MNILSLFDGISCGQLALQRAGIKVDNYFASEIDVYAQAVTQTRFPNTIQLGDINDWQSWDLPHIDFIMGGSPCQGFSNAGKGLNFDDPRSKLFFTFVDILKHYQPQYFLLENVRMKKEWQNIITEYLQFVPILINSALVSAQNRRRLYWTNIPNINQPQDKNIFLQDILEDCVAEKYYKSNTAMQYAEIHNIRLHYSRDKANAITASWNSGKQERRNDVLVNGDCDLSNFLLVNDYKPQSIKNYLRDNFDKIQFNNYKSESSRKRIINNARQLTKKSGCLTKKGQDPTGASQNILFYNDFTWRKLTPLECERLQTIPDNYTLVVHPKFHGRMMSNSRRYMMVGNAWTVDVIAHIFNFIK